MHENEISKIIIGAAIKVHKKTGPGMLESMYEKCLYTELRKSNVFIERQKEIELVYDGVNYGVCYRADLIIENKVLIELKSVEQLSNLHASQTYTYIKILNLKLGILINFNTPLLKDGIHRIVNKLD